MGSLKYKMLLKNPYCTYLGDLLSLFTKVTEVIS